MGKINLDFTFIDDQNKEMSTITFKSLEDIDLCIERLQEARAEFERRIEAKKQQNREKRERRRLNKASNNVPKEVLDHLRKAEDTYNKMPEYLKPVFKPMLDMAKQLVEDAKKGADA